MPLNQSTEETKTLTVVYDTYVGSSLAWQAEDAVGEVKGVSVRPHTSSAELTTWMLNIPLSSMLFEPPLVNLINYEHFSNK